MEELERHLKSLAKNSRKRFETVISQLTDFTKKPIWQTTESDLFEFIDFMDTWAGMAARRTGHQGLSGATKRNILEVLSSCFGVLHRRGKMPYNPVKYSGIRKPSALKNQKRPTEILPFIKVIEICQRPDRRTKEGVRDRALLALLFGAGLRRSEAINLTLGSIRVYDEETLFLQLRNTKSGKDRSQCLATWAAEATTRLIEQRISEDALPLDPFLTNYIGWPIENQRPENKPMSGSTLYRAFKRYTMDIDDGFYSPHSARATAISYLWDQEEDPRRIQEFAGHGDFRSTIVYDKRHLKDTARKLSFQ